MDEVKVVISIKGERGFIGVQAPNCDPILAAWAGDLASALERIPALVEEAQQQWADSPRYPKCPVPPPSQAQPVTTTRATQTQSRQAATSQPRPQINLF